MKFSYSLIISFFLVYIAGVKLTNSIILEGIMDLIIIFIAAIILYANKLEES